MDEEAVRLSAIDLDTIPLGNASDASVAALAHLTEVSFPFPKIWSLYPAIPG